MRCQCNKIRLDAGIRGRMSKDNRASARERWSASLGMPVWPSCPRGPDPRYCVSDVQHLMGESATNRIDALPQRFRLFVGSLAHGSAMAAMQLQQRIRLRIPPSPASTVTSSPLSNANPDLDFLGPFTEPGRIQKGLKTSTSSSERCSSEAMAQSPGGTGGRLCAELLALRSS